MVHMFVQPSMKMLKLENVIHSINVLDMSRRKKKKSCACFNWTLRVLIA
jgi:hypothetical protein